MRLELGLLRADWKMGLQWRSGTDTRRAWEADVDSPDDAADVVPFDEQAAGPSRSTVNNNSEHTAAENNHGAAADVSPSIGTVSLETEGP